VNGVSDGGFHWATPRSAPPRASKPALVLTGGFLIAGQRDLVSRHPPQHKGESNERAHTLHPALTVSGVTASSGAIQKARDLLKSTTTVGPLAAGTTYGARLIDPTPNLTPTVGGWFGAQFLDHQSGKVRYETAILFWHGQRHEVDIARSVVAAGLRGGE
jgi:hypothetical protein